MEKKPQLTKDQQHVVQEWVDRAIELYSASKEDDLDALFMDLENQDTFTEAMYVEFERLYMKHKYDSDPVLKRIQMALRADRGRNGLN